MTNLSVPNSFVSGTVANASDVNENFQAVVDLINTTGVPKVQSGSVNGGDIAEDARLPSGMIADFAGASAPSGWLLCHGQAVSRASYAALFTAISTQYGAGDGSTTFNLPDLRGRVTAGLDNMGGTAAGRITGATTLGGSGGVQFANVGVNELPTHTHAVSVSVSASGSAADHSHTSGSLAFAVNNGAAGGGSGNTAVMAQSTGSPTGATAGSTGGASALGVSVSGSGSGSATTITGHTGQTALSRLQPYMALNKIIKV